MSKMTKTATIHALLEEIARARKKFPGTRHMHVALSEEVGELAEALLKFGNDDPRTKAEALQVACVAIRIYEEGDADFADGVNE